MGGDVVGGGADGRRAMETASPLARAAPWRWSHAPRQASCKSTFSRQVQTSHDSSRQVTTGHADAPTVEIPDCSILEHPQDELQHINGYAPGRDAFSSGGVGVIPLQTVSSTVGALISSLTCSVNYNLGFHHPPLAPSHMVAIPRMGRPRLCSGTIVVHIIRGTFPHLFCSV